TQAGGLCAKRACCRLSVSSSLESASSQSECTSAGRTGYQSLRSFAPRTGQGEAPSSQRCLLCQNLSSCHSERSRGISSYSLLVMIRDVLATLDMTKERWREQQSQRPRGLTAQRLSFSPRRDKQRQAGYTLPDTAAEGSL